MLWPQDQQLLALFRYYINHRALPMCHAYSSTQQQTCTHFSAQCQDQAVTFHLSDLAQQEDRPRDQL